MEQRPENGDTKKDLPKEASFDISKYRLLQGEVRGTGIVLPIEHLITGMNDWWDDLCKERGIDPDANEEFSEIGYQLLELVKNAFEYGTGGGDIKVTFDKDAVIATIENSGEAFDPLEAIHISAGGGHGFYRAIEWADDIEIETGGKRYIKDAEETLRESGTSPITDGAKITLKKKV